MESSEGGKIYPNLQEARDSQVPGVHQMNPPPPSQPTVVQQVIVTQTFGSEPTNAYCSNCGTNVTSDTSTEATALAWVSCLLLFCFGCWPCACVPFCVCQKTTHKCPFCNNFLGESN